MVKIACSRLSDSEEDAKVKGTRKVGGAKRGKGKEDCKNTFSSRQVHKAGSSVRSSSSALLCAVNLVNICSTQELSWILLFHARGRRMPSFWVTGTTRFESVDIICQIWPIRGYARSWFLPERSFKEMITGWQAPPRRSCSPQFFVFARAWLSRISEPGTGEDDSPVQRCD